MVIRTTIDDLSSRLNFEETRNLVFVIHKVFRPFCVKA